MASSQSNQHTVHNNTNPPPPPALVRVHLNRPHTQSLRTAQTQSAHLIPIPSASTTTHNNDLLKMKRYVSALSRSNPRLALNSLNWLYSLRLTPNVTVALINFGIINKLLYLFAPLTSSVSSLPPMHAVPTTTTIRLEDQVKTIAAALLSKFARLRPRAIEIITHNAKGVAFLVACLDAKYPDVVVSHVAQALMNICRGSRNSLLIVKNRGFQKLVQLLTHKEHRIRLYSCGVLSSIFKNSDKTAQNLAHDLKVQKSLSAMVDSKSELIQYSVARCIASLVSGNARTANGFDGSLLARLLARAFRYLRWASLSSALPRQQRLELFCAQADAIAALCFVSGKHKSMFLEKGALKLIFECMVSSSTFGAGELAFVRRALLPIVISVCTESVACQQQVKVGGCLEQMMQMFDTDSHIDVKRLVILAFSAAVKDNRVNQDTVYKLNAIPKAVNFLMSPSTHTSTSEEKTYDQRTFNREICLKFLAYICHNNQPIQLYLQQKDIDQSALQTFASSSQQRIRVMAANTLNSLCVNNRIVQDSLVALNVLPALFHNCEVDSFFAPAARTLARICFNNPKLEKLLQTKYLRQFLSIVNKVKRLRILQQQTRSRSAHAPPPGPPSSSSSVVK